MVHPMKGTETTTSMPSFMFCAPLLCAPFQKNKVCHYLCSIHLYFVCLSRKTMLMPPSPMFPCWFFVHVYALFIVDTYLWMLRTPSLEHVNTPLLATPSLMVPIPNVLLSQVNNHSSKLLGWIASPANWMHVRTMCLGCHRYNLFTKVIVVDTYKEAIATSVDWRPLH
jgi:hypothetical protein